MAYLDLAYPHTCTIVRLASALNDGGQPVESATGETVEGVRCNWQPRGTREYAGRQSRTLEHDRLFLPDGTVIAEQDQVTDVKVHATGALIAAGPLEVIGLAPWPGSHVEAELELAE